MASAPDPCRPDPPVGVGDPPAYIRELLAWARADVRQVYIRTTASVGLVLVFLTQVKVGQVNQLSMEWRRAVFGAFVALGISALLSFYYVSKTHVAVRCAARHLITCDTASAYSAVKRVYSGLPRTALVVANILLGSGALVLVAALGSVLHVYG
jgi:hypothetical protein